MSATECRFCAGECNVPGSESNLLVHLALVVEPHEDETTEDYLDRCLGELERLPA